MVTTTSTSEARSKGYFILTLLEIMSTLLFLFGLTPQILNSVSSWQYGILNNWTAITWSLIILITASVVGAILWHRKDPTRNSSVHQWLQTFVSFYVAYMICIYAFAKILGTQFNSPQYVQDTPIGELSGFRLTWAYYGFSRTLASIIGATQIAGCILLLFRKTRLLGVFVLIPVMINICLIDHFYIITPTAYFNALHYTFILFFLLALDAGKLMDVFFSVQEKLRLNSWKTWVLNVARVTIILLSFNKIYSSIQKSQPITKLNGVWEIEKVKRQGEQKVAWSKLYFERFDICLFRDGSYQPFKLKDLRANYKVDEAKANVRIKLSPPKGQKTGDSLILQYRFSSDSSLSMVGLYNADSISMELKRLK
jgi:hypothetical protein